MNCKSTVEMLSAYLDRELGHVERDAVRSHLADCDRCRAEERDLRALKGLLLGVRAPEPTADFEQRLMRQLRDEAVRPVRSRLALPRFGALAWGQLGGLAAAAMLAGVVLSLRGPQREAGNRPVISTHTTVAQNVDPDVYAQHSEAYWQGGDYSATPLMPTSYGP